MKNSSPAITRVYLSAPGYVVGIAYALFGLALLTRPNATGSALRLIESWFSAASWAVPAMMLSAAALMFMSRRLGARVLATAPLLIYAAIACYYAFSRPDAALSGAAALVGLWLCSIVLLIVEELNRATLYAPLASKAGHGG
ncbi:MAG: hypothetical protein SF123_09645 [Chloroflexota bacterium]|nr:hypothetical protein [Chloroflexota bacterium]